MTLFSKSHTPKIILGGFIVVAIVFVAGAWYGKSQISQLHSDISTLSGQVALLETNFSSTTAELKGNIAQTHSSLSSELSKEKQASAAIEQKLGNYQQQVSSYSGTVETLQKLSKTDPELLAKYSKVFFLNEYYAPARLTEIPNDYAYSDNKALKFQTDIWPHLKQMIDDAKKAEVPIYVSSAYRSFNEQSALKGQYKVVYGAGSANAFSADQGYSEHQLGTTVDLITTGLGGQLEGFDNTKAYSWLLANAYKYGFILSYPQGNTSYIFEPWHWRYVGVKLATDLHTQGKGFYDLDQRKIDEYLVNFAD